MSGVVRDETNPVGPSDEKLAAERADQRQAPDARQDTDSEHRDGAEDGEEARALPDLGALVGMSGEARGQDEHEGGPQAGGGTSDTGREDARHAG